MTMKRKHAPWFPAPYEKSDAYALKALQRGTANEHQQQRALKWIIEQACQTYDMPYSPDSSRDSDFAMGKQFVGQQIVKLLNINIIAVDEISAQVEQIKKKGQSRKTKEKK